MKSPNPETYLFPNELYGPSGYIKFWNRCRDSFKSQNLGIQDVFTTWKKLADNYNNPYMSMETWDKINEWIGSQGLE